MIVFHIVNQIEVLGRPPEGFLEVRQDVLEAERQRLIDAGVSANTTRAYSYDWSRFRCWCEATGRRWLPATSDTLASHVTALTIAGLSPNTIARAMTSIRVAHRVQQHEPPDTTEALTVLRGYRRQDSTHQEQPAPPLLLPDLRKLIEVCNPDAVGGTRDRALIVLGWAMMARRSELAGLWLTDMSESSDGLTVHVRASKTDRDAKGRDVAIPYGTHPDTCPVRLTRSWVEVVSASDGRVFRPVDRHGRIGGDPKFAGRSSRPFMTGQGVEVAIAKVAARAGLVTAGYTPHSLRAGGATEAYRQGADPLAIARHGGWKDNSPVLLRYIRSVDKWKENPMRGVGL